MINIGSVWDRTTEFLGDNMGRVMPLAIVGFFAPTCIWACVAPVANTATPSQKLAIYAGLLVMSVWSSWGKLAVTALALDPAASTGGAAQTGIQRLLPYLLVSIVIGAALLVLGAPILVALKLGGMDFTAVANGSTQQPMPSVASLSFVVLYGLALLAVVLVVAPRLALVAPVVVGERLGIGAIRRSVALTRGYTIRIIGLLLLYVIVAQVSVLAAKLVFGTVFRLLFGDHGPLSIAAVLTTIVVGVVTTIFSVLAATFVANLYLALRDARGIDVAAP